MHAGHLRVRCDAEREEFPACRWSTRMPLSHDADAYRTIQATEKNSEHQGPTHEGWRGPCHFEVYRDKRVRITTVLFSSADWHWRLVSPLGNILAVSEGLASEAECGASIEKVRKHAAAATVASPGV